MATQRPSSNVINADLKNNIQFSCLLGDFDSGGSTLLFDKDISHMSKPEIKGRGFLQSGKEIYEFQSYWTEKEKDFLLRNGATMSDSDRKKKDQSEDSLDDKLKQASDDPEKQELIRSLEGNGVEEHVQQKSEEVKLPEKSDPNDLRKEGKEENQKHHDEMIEAMRAQREKEMKRSEMQEDSLPDLSKSGDQKPLGGRIPRKMNEEKVGSKNPVSIQMSQPIVDESGEEIPVHQSKRSDGVMLPPKPVAGGASELGSHKPAIEQQKAPLRLNIASQKKKQPVKLKLNQPTAAAIKSNAPSLQPQQMQQMVLEQEVNDDPFNIVT